MSGFIKRFQAFRSDEAGTILVFWALCLTVVFGLVALSFDLGRYAITRTEYQSFADHVALAAAGELDGNAGAISRATAAAALISDRQHFGVADGVLTGGEDYTLTFYTTLPDSDLTVMTAVTTADSEAAYVRVDVTPTSVLGTFANILQPGASGSVTASATAGFDTWACDVTPLMFCMPEAPLVVGNQILLRSGGQGSAWGPGDFGFLDPSDMKIDENGPCAEYVKDWEADKVNGGGKLYACILGAVGGHNACFKKRGVDTQPGQRVGLGNAAFNVRFDMYDSVLNNANDDPAYAPAPNVIKGLVGNGNAACIQGKEQPAGVDNQGVVNPTKQSIALPRDSCFNTAGSTCRFGSGDWSRTLYNDTNYGTGPGTGDVTHLGVSSSSTRYEYYLAEIAHWKTVNSILPATKEENGRPTCSKEPPAGPERRLIIAAGVDCKTNPVSGKTSNVPVEKFVKIFITEPVGSDGSSPPSFDIFGEIVDFADGSGDQSGKGGLIRNMVQLYR
ncbi:Tad domain-containing protein [Sedimentimonas flavescens]|uniref:Tad domain-containing protein n=1 Tax=Sedimentimonas flavescens TaxID=2851012 RepID=UPI0021A533EF|nr:Tad domain-containing protein [Sedimentimonas flavescens]MCT2538602.1 Tad domain-containing protein [Sedimentimonas flavescens]